MVEAIKALRAELVEKFITAAAFDDLKGDFKTMNDLVTKKMDTKITEIEEALTGTKTDLEEKSQDLYRVTNSLKKNVGKKLDQHDFDEELDEIHSMINAMSGLTGGPKKGAARKER